ncbi:hypothetical protein AWB79_01180 [Caballeronia hypogeia]|uniref:DUF218 domain-containing protein n=1 Tax=Caballeronia hypogeia TaxID=1777140 RepID=A0A157ZPH6_9BURK|nr:YdcF family protein [Caballeronia hypogeia]SAK46867.1 hypothetical protein AWB79_01180 [Caballeronia hypogeia]
MVLISLLLVFVVLFVVWKKRRVAIFLLACAVFWLLGSWLPGPLVRLANSGYDTMHEPRFGTRTVIIVLGGGTKHDRHGLLVPKGDSMTRIVLASSLYRRCMEMEKECLVVMSGGNPQRHEQSEADLYGSLLLDAGVNRADLILENKSLDTYENARNTEKILRSRQYDTSVLVTSSLHMRRALLAFAAFDLDPQPAVAIVRRPMSWWVPHPRGWFDSNSALHELVGIARFYVWRLLGLY